MKKTITTTLSLLLSLSILGTTAFADFSDVKSDTYYKKAIYWMLNKEIINGYKDGTFKPDQCVNRAEFLKMLFNTSGANTNLSAELFKDTYADQWYTPYIKTARAKGTIEGYSDGTFKPDQCVNRVEAIKMALLEFNEGKIPPQWGEYAIPYDVSQMNSKNQWWGPYLDSALGSNYVGTEHFVKFNVDYGNKEQNDFMNPRFNFGPAESMTRKEVAEILYRLKYSEENNIEHFPGYNTKEIAFDGCGKTTDYKNETWFTDFAKHDGLATELEIMGGGSSESCLALDKSLFISIIPMSGEYEYNGLYSYNIKTGEFEKTVFLFKQLEEENGFHTFNHYVTAFGKRVGDYIEITGDGFGKDSKEWTGKYYYQENYVVKN